MIILVYKPYVVFRFVDYLFCFHPPNRLFFCLKAISVVSLIRRSVYVVKTKALISFVVTAKLICVFVFTYAKCWFSHEAAHILDSIQSKTV